MLTLIAIYALAPAAPSAPGSALEKLAVGDWLTYEVSAVDVEQLPCCFKWRGGKMASRGCRLDNGPRSVGTSLDEPQVPVGREALQIYVRRAASGFDRVLAVGASCPVDAANQKVTALTAVETDTSVSFLANRLTDKISTRIANDTLTAIAHHEGTKATEALVRHASYDRPGRRQAYFWLAHKRDRPGFDAVRKAIEQQRSGALRRHLVFCLSQSPLDIAVDTLREMARSHSDQSLRGEALFWLAQERDRDVEAIAFTQIDAGTTRKTKKRAVFALSQLPTDRSLRALKRIIRSDRPRSIRKEALFWLAQKDDDRVLTEFDRILSGDQ